MKYLWLTLKITWKMILGFFLIVAVYFIVAGICSCIPVNTDYKEPASGVTIAVLSNGVHTDIAVPVKNETADWTTLLPYADVQHADSTFRYISFGWGDKGFYIGTPTWADLKAGTAFKAVFWLSTSAMHVTWYDALPQEGMRCRKFRITNENYAALCDFIRRKFDYDSNGKIELIKAKPYGSSDAFY